MGFSRVRSAGPPIPPLPGVKPGVAPGAIPVKRTKGEKKADYAARKAKDLEEKVKADQSRAYLELQRKEKAAQFLRDEEANRRAEEARLEEEWRRAEEVERLSQEEEKNRREEMRWAKDAITDLT